MVPRYCEVFEIVLCFSSSQLCVQLAGESQLWLSLRVLGVFSLQETENLVVRGELGELRAPEEGRSQCRTSCPNIQGTTS
eukprot:1082518-Rhodomonas_salina.1